MAKIPYGRQLIDQSDIDAVAQVLKSDFLTTGPKVEEFEQSLCAFIGASHAVAVNSGTSALDMAVGSLRIQPGSEIITTPFTFMASANAVLYNGCVPVFADIDPHTYNIDPAAIAKKITNKTKAILYVDYAGQPCAIDEISELAKKHNLFTIEDAAHSLGAEYKGVRVGKSATLTCFSFHPVKHITTGEGGAVLTESPELAAKLRMLRNHGIDKTPSERSSYLYDMKLLGRNYRITDFQCALGISQMKKLPAFLKRRRELAKMYEKELAGLDGVQIPPVSPDVSHAYHLYTILIGKGISRDKVYEAMRKKGIGVNVHYVPVYRFSYYKLSPFRKRFGVNPKDYPATEDIFARILTIPLYHGMKDGELSTVVRCLKESIREAKG